jgi:DNA mismatch repair protein MutL
LVQEVPLAADLLDRVALLIGAEVRDRLYPVEAERGPLVLRGYVADPACDGRRGPQRDSSRR